MDAAGTALLADAALPRWSERARPAVRGALMASAPLAILVVAGLGVWEWLSDIGVIPRYILPAPQALLGAMVTTSEALTRHGLVTIQEAVGGFLLGNAIAIAASLLFAASRAVRLCFYPLALASRAVPIVAITPLLVILLGRGMLPIIVVVAISVYFPTLLNMLRGLRSADVEYQELLYSLNASRWQRLRIVELPACLPYLFAALKVGASVAFIGAIVGEWIGANSGLGYLIVISANYFRIPAMWAAITVAATLTLLLVAAVSTAEKFATPWRHEGTGDL